MTSPCSARHRVLLSLAGFCEPTDDGESDCVHGDRGAWRVDTSVDVARSAPTPTLQAQAVVDLWSCVERCRACSRCRFVSYSQRFKDCSWYYECDLKSLRRALPHLNVSGGFRTVRMSDADAASVPSAAGSVRLLRDRLEMAAWEVAVVPRIPKCAARSVVLSKPPKVPPKVQQRGSSQASESSLSRKQILHLARYFPAVQPHLATSPLGRQHRVETAASPPRTTHIRRAGQVPSAQKHAA